MKLKLTVFLLAAGLMAYGQGRPGGAGRPAGAGGGMGQGMGQAGQMGRPSDMERPSDTGRPATAGRQGEMGASQTQQPLKDSQINGGAFKMLETKTGMTADQLKALYASSGARNFGQFVSAVVVSKNLNLDTNKVLEGLKTESLGKTLQSMGVSSSQANAEIKKAKKEAAAASKSS